MQKRKHLLVNCEHENHLDKRTMSTPTRIQHEGTLCNHDQAYFVVLPDRAAVSSWPAAATLIDDSKRPETVTPPLAKVAVDSTEHASKYQIKQLPYLPEQTKHPRSLQCVTSVVELSSAGILKGYIPFITLPPTVTSSLYSDDLTFTTQRRQGPAHTSLRDEHSEHGCMAH